MPLLDSYDLKARYTPAFLAGLPLAFIAISMVSGASLKTLSGLGVALPVSYALAQLARSLGKRHEQRLWQSWGGEPVVQVLQGRDPRLDPVTLARYHRKLSELTGTTGNDADTYASWSRWLRANIKGKTYPLVLAENIAYGFWRNGYGVRLLGIACAIIATAWVVLMNGCLSCPLDFTQAPAFLAGLSDSDKLGLALTGPLLAFWIIGPTEARIKEAAFTYSERLLGALDDYPASAPKG